MEQVMAALMVRQHAGSRPCTADDHDRSLPDDPQAGQAVAADGLLGCNDCGEPLYYCLNDNWYHHVDPDRECFLAGA